MKLSEDLSVKSRPWLLIQDVTDKCKLVYYDVSEKKCYKKVILELENKKICHSSYGWFILKDVVSKDYCLFNPSTSEAIQLPPLATDEELDTYLFLSPKDSNCHVIFFDEKNSTLFFCKPKDTHFIQQAVKWFRGFTMLGEMGYCWFLEGQSYTYSAIKFEGSQIMFKRLPVKMPSLFHQC
ncbi:hypothetical protein M5689_015315 [Euphorbia peplus]|nr:hypothetical protein M5689_015315 [Euphorbia peplus]